MKSKTWMPPVSSLLRISVKESSSKRFFFFLTTKITTMIMKTTTITAATIIPIIISNPIPPFFDRSLLPSSSTGRPPLYA